MHKGCLHHKVCRAIWKSILSQIFFWEKNCNSGRLVPIAHGARVFKNFRRSIINITLFFPYLRAILVDFQSFWERFNRLPWKLYCLHFIFCFRRLVTSFRNIGDTLRIHTQHYFGKFRRVKRNKKRFVNIQYTKKESAACQLLFGDSRNSTVKRDIEKTKGTDSIL